MTCYELMIGMEKCETLNELRRFVAENIDDLMQVELTQSHHDIITLRSVFMRALTRTTGKAWPLVLMDEGFLRERKRNAKTVRLQDSVRESG